MRAEGRGRRTRRLRSLRVRRCVPEAGASPGSRGRRAREGRGVLVARAAACFSCRVRAAVHVAAAPRAPGRPRGGRRGPRAGPHAALTSCIVGADRVPGVRSPARAPGPRRSSGGRPRAVLGSGHGQVSSPGPSRSAQAGVLGTCQPPGRPRCPVRRGFLRRCCAGGAWGQRPRVGGRSHPKEPPPGCGEAAA